METKLPEGVRVLATKPQQLRGSTVAIYDRPGGYTVVAFDINGKPYEQAARTWREACEVAAQASAAIATQFLELSKQRPPLVGGVIL